MSTVEKIDVHRAVTPSGIVVEFESAPKRLYRVNGVEVPSVTSVLGCLEKGGLSWWGMQVGIDGTLGMIQAGKIGKTLTTRVPVVYGHDGSIVGATKENVTELLKQHKLTVNHTLTKAGDRGTSVHRALELWGEHRIADPKSDWTPDPNFYPEEERGYVIGLCKFFDDLNLSARPKMELETMVGSVQHGYAGRYDMAVTIGESELVTNVTPVRGETREVFPKGRILADLKTSKGTYDTHHLQLAAYDLAAQECGYPKTAYQMVIRVGADGNYVVTRSRATPQDFLAVKGAYDALSSLKGRK